MHKILQRSSGKQGHNFFPISGNTDATPQCLSVCEDYLGVYMKFCGHQFITRILKKVELWM